MPNLTEESLTPSVTRYGTRSLTQNTILSYIAYIVDRSVDLAATQTGGMSLSELYEQGKGRALEYAIDSEGRTIPEITQLLEAELTAACKYGTETQNSSFIDLRDTLQVFIDAECSATNDCTHHRWATEDMRELDGLTRAIVQGHLQSMMAPPDKPGRWERKKMMERLVGQHHGYEAYCRQLAEKQ